MMAVGYDDISRLFPGLELLTSRVGHRRLLLDLLRLPLKPLPADFLAIQAVVISRLFWRRFKARPEVALLALSFMSPSRAQSCADAVAPDGYLGLKVVVLAICH